MQPNLTNLLPENRLRALARGYVFRVVVVASVLLTLLGIVHALLLFPSYIYLHQKVRAHTAELADLNARAVATDQGAIEARIGAIEASAKQLTLGAKQPTASGAVRAVLAAPRAGIKITAVTYTPSPAKGIHRMTLAGVASTRDTLRTYVQTLSALPFIKAAELPISAYAKETAIDFTITLSGTFTP